MSSLWSSGPYYQVRVRRGPSRPAYVVGLNGLKRRQPFQGLFGGMLGTAGDGVLWYSGVSLFMSGAE